MLRHTGGRAPSVGHRRRTSFRKTCVAHAHRSVISTLQSVARSVHHRSYSLVVSSPVSVTRSNATVPSFARLTINIKLLSISFRALWSDVLITAGRTEARQSKQSLSLCSPSPPWSSQSSSSSVPSIMRSHRVPVCCDSLCRVRTRLARHHHLPTRLAHVHNCRSNRLYNARIR